jgi:hypothetical protein
MWQRRRAPAAQIPTTRMDSKKKDAYNTCRLTAVNTRNEKAIPYALLL